jgi:hypothetical protein
MFDRMGHAWDIRLIAEISHIDVKGSTGFVSLRIVHQKSLKLIAKSNDPVVAVVKRGLLERVGDKCHRYLGASRCGGGILVML